MASFYQNNSFGFTLPSSKTVPATLSHVNLVKEKHQIKEFHLYFQVVKDVSGELFPNHEEYLFEQAYESFIQKTDASKPILVHAVLVPEYLPFVRSVNSSEEALACLEKTFKKHPDHPLIHMQSWLTLSIQQQQDNGPYTYRTIWNYLDWSQIARSKHIFDEYDDRAINISSQYIKDFLQEELKFFLAKNEIDQPTFDNGIELLDEMLDLLPSLDLKNDFSYDDLDRLNQVFAKSIYDQVADRLSQVQIEEEEEHWNNLSSVKISDMLTQFFEARDIEFSRHESQSIFYFSCSGTHDQWDCYIQFDDLNGSACMYSMLPSFVPKRMRRRTAEFLSRINYRLSAGNFDLNFDDGDIRCKTYLYDPNRSCQEDAIEHFIVSNLTAVDDYLPRIKQVVKGHLDTQSTDSILEELLPVG